MKKKFSFIVDCERIADIAYCRELIAKTRKALGDIRFNLSADDITKAQVAEEREATRIATLPKLYVPSFTSVKGSEGPNIGGKRVSESTMSKMRMMPTMARAEAHAWLEKLVGYEWDTREALEDDGDLSPFISEYDEEHDVIPGVFRGSNYETDSEIADRLAWEDKASEREAERQKAEREAAERKKLEDAKIDEERRQKEAEAKAERERVETEANERAEDYRKRVAEFNLWLSENFPSKDTSISMREYFRDGLESPIRGVLVEHLTTFCGASHADASEIADMLEAYELHVWEIFTDEELAEVDEMLREFKEAQD
jgi:hypothetical protein